MDELGGGGRGGGGFITNVNDYSVNNGCGLATVMQTVILAKKHLFLFKRSFYVNHVFVFSI